MFGARGERGADATEENTIRPTTWSEVYEAIFEGTFNERTQRYKSRYAFRGVSCASYSLDNSLRRMKGEFAKVEPHLLRQFKKYGRNYIRDGSDDDWYWLCVAQHYGLPTRLLDWSYSPQIALHFATCNVDRYDQDGAIWKVNYKELHKRTPHAIRKLMSETDIWILTIDMLARAFPTIEDLEIEGKKREFVLFFEPPSIDSRLYNQFAYFSVPSSPGLLLDQWLLSQPDVWQKVIIPKELKWEIRDKLDQSNISERVLLPGLDGLARWLKRYYHPTGSAADAAPR